MRYFLVTGGSKYLIFLCVFNRFCQVIVMYKGGNFSGWGGGGGGRFKVSLVGVVLLKSLDSDPV